MQAFSTAESYFTRDPQFDTWLGKPISDEGTYEGADGVLTEWFNGVYWNTRIRIKSGSPQLTDDLVAEGCANDRTVARLKSERVILTKLMGLINNAHLLGVLGSEFKF